MSDKLTEQQRALGEFYMWLQLRADFLRQQKAEAAETLASTATSAHNTDQNDRQGDYTPGRSISEAGLQR